MFLKIQVIDNGYKMLVAPKGYSEGKNEKDLEEIESKRGGGSL